MLYTERNNLPFEPNEDIIELSNIMDSIANYEGRKKLTKQELIQGCEQLIKRNKKLLKENDILKERENAKDMIIIELQRAIRGITGQPMGEVKYD